MGNHLFVIFAVLAVLFAVNWCLNHSFFYIYMKDKRIILFSHGDMHVFSEIEKCLHACYLVGWLHWDMYQYIAVM